MDLHYEEVDMTISPGLTTLRWTSVNFDPYISEVAASLNKLELLIDRLTDMQDNQILIILKEIQAIPLIELPESGTLKVTEFYNITDSLCSKAGATIDTKSQVIERTVHEIIDLIMGPERILEAQSEEKGTPGALSLKRKLEQRTKLLQEVENLIMTYEQMLVDAQIRLLRKSLEAIKHRLSVKMFYEDKNGKSHNPLFESDLVLAVPSIVMKPSLDDIQQELNRAATALVSITKVVYRWGQNRCVAGPSPPDAARPLHSRSGMRTRSRVIVEETISSMKTFYRPVSENKEILKLVSALSSSINSSKSFFTAVTETFTKYSHLWSIEQEVKMQEFMAEGNPGVSDFSNEMNDYAQLEKLIELEPETIPAGPVALNAERLRLALTTEARAWIVCYGRTMSSKYQTVMENVFKSIDDWTKRLSRPLKDLDDIRSIMATLKEIREKEIEVDMSLDPIEVRG